LNRNLSEKFPKIQENNTTHEEKETLRIFLLYTIELDTKKGGRKQK